MTEIIPTEYAECLTFAGWLRVKGIKFAHIPNETFTTSFKAKMKNKNMGVSPGIPDYLVVLPKGLLFIEMKRKKGGTLSPFQKDWIDALNPLKGVEARVAKGADEAIKIVEEFL